MPELPEVETVVRGLQLLLPGLRILSVELGKTDFIDDPNALEKLVPGCRIINLRRHGKFIVLTLERDSTAPTTVANERGRLSLIFHLGMTGRLTVPTSGAPCQPHTHAQFILDNNRELRFTDARRFGRIALLPESQSERILGPLGLDALQINENEFRECLAGRRARIKAVLLDQHVIRGMGNIYTDESFWRARIHPARLAAALRPEEVRLLFQCMQRVLREAIRLGGSTISDYVDAEGEPGEFQLRHRVYQREGKKCARCGGRIQRITVAGRSSYFCPRCQEAPRTRKSKKHKTARVAAPASFSAKNRSEALPAR